MPSPCRSCAARILDWQVDLPLLAAAWLCDGWLAGCMRKRCCASKPAGYWYEPADRACFAALAQFIPRRQWAKVFPVIPRRCWPGTADWPRGSTTRAPAASLADRRRSRASPGSPSAWRGRTHYGGVGTAARTSLRGLSPKSAGWRRSTVAAGPSLRLRSAAVPSFGSFLSVSPSSGARGQRTG